MSIDCQLQIKNQLPELNRLQAMLEEFFQQQQLPGELAGEMMLVSEELLVNTISYGYQDECEHVIEITMRICADSFSMTLVDDGCPFNPLLQKPPPMGQPSEDVAIGGLGIPLICSLSDHQEYHHRNGRNIFIFSKLLRTGN